jgi:hypothetical protein
MATEKPKRGRTRTLILALVGVLVVCGVISVLMSIFSDGPATADPAPTVAAVEAIPTEPPVEPTALPEPTDTPVPIPTDAPVPTVVPTEAAAGETAEELAYRLSVIDIAGQFEEGLGGLGAQSTAAGETPSLMFDEDWKIATAVYLASISVASDRVRELDPPAKFQAVHDELLIAAGHFDTMTTLYAEGVDEVSADKLGLALESMQLGSESAQRVTALLQELNTP